jgi:hypothetical protein
MYGRAAACALAVVRAAVEAMEPREFPIQDVGWDAYRLAAVRILGGGQ